jgi:HSP20 family protein
MAKDMIRFMQSFFMPVAQVAGGAAWQPSADVYRTRDGWLVKLDLAGVRPEDVQVSVSGSRLTVRGVRRDWSLEEGCCHYQMEISYSHFERSLTLPVSLEHTQLSAEHRNGMLLIHVRQEDEQQ